MSLHDMSYQKKVVWSEGMFLRPQHLQQQDRYVDAQFRDRNRLSSPFDWGIRKFQVDDQVLQQGAFAIVHCDGIMPDGTLFHCHSKEHRLLREIPPGRQDVLIYLALPVALQGADEAADENDENSLTRWVRSDEDVLDSNQGSSKRVNITLANPRFSLLLEDELSADFTRIPIARIKESFADGRLELDQYFIPPCLSISVSGRLTYFMQETLSLLTHRAQAISTRLNGSSGQRGSTDLADFLLLQMVNRYSALLKHHAEVEYVHPETLYQVLIMLNGETATFTEESKQPKPQRPYDHRNLTLCFNHLMGDIRQALSLVFEQTALALPLQERDFGVRVAPIHDRSLLDQAQFYLAIRCDWSKEQVSSRMPTVIKAGGVEQLRELVNLQLPGIGLVALPVAPRQIPYGSNFTYFQLEKSPQNWAHLKTSGGIAFHFSGEVPGLELELWAVKG
ncbi:MAG: type VI secretion system baseplate subunit TssK [Ketobacter sp.]|nr:MAG: type VI secretion system baseplate subunit TssK [Ketobacter sp.]